MADVSPTFTSRWQSGNHIGPAKPVLRGAVRDGRFNRAYGSWDDDNYPVDATIGDSDPDMPWQATWTPTGDYVDLPNVFTCTRTKTFDGNGIEEATIVIENIVYAEHAGDPAAYHTRERGYLAPLRGYVADGRTPLLDEAGDELEPNEWFGLLSQDAQITIWECYGNAESKVFTGLIDDVDVTSRPDRITVTARSFGKALTDERIFGWNKDPAINDPVVFISFDDAHKKTMVGYNADSSSDLSAGHDADKVTDGDGSTDWISQQHSSSANTEWVEIRVPEGRYTQLHINPAYPEDFYLSINPKVLANGDDPTRDGDPLTPNDWTDAHSGDLIPGSFGGITYERHVTGVTGEGFHSLGDGDEEFVLGTDSVIRCSFRPLIADDEGDFYAGVISLRAQRLTLVDEPAADKWVIVNDITAVVTAILRWAGFKEWDVTSAQADLPKRLLLNRGTSYIDAIKQIAEAIGYVFYLRDPDTSDDDSIGLPVFRPSSVITGTSGSPSSGSSGIVATVRDSDLLTGIDVKSTDQPLAYIIRVRGRETTNGQTLGGDATKRVQYTFSPPWRGTPPDYTDTRLGGLIKHVIYTNPLFRSLDDCRFAAYYIALQQALDSIKAVIEFPSYPAIDLDDLVVLEDVGTGLTTRLRVSERVDTFQAGENASWKMNVTGTLLDTVDVQAMVAIINDAIAG